MRGSTATAAAAVVVVLGLLSATASSSAQGTTYVVGGAAGWNYAVSPTQYNDWAAGIKFFVGDKLGT
jgi:ABC-type sugar transport system substrate-binding protein